MKTIKFITPKGECTGIANFIRLYKIQHIECADLIKNTDKNYFYLKGDRIEYEFYVTNHYKGFKKYIQITRDEYYHNGKVSDRLKFMLNVKKTNKCWEWVDVNKKNPFTFIMRGNSFNCARASYILFHEHVHYKHDVIQKCGNIKCVNPEHLTLDYRPMKKSKMIVKYQTKENNYIYLVYEKMMKGWNLVKTLGQSYDIQHDVVCNYGEKIHL